MKNKISASLLLFCVIIIFTLVSCDPTKKYEKEERSVIDHYLAQNPTLNFELKKSGLYFLDVTVGTGIVPKTSDTVYIKYTGKFLDGTVFDTNVGKSDTLVYPAFEGYLIYGFEEGVSFMKEGGKSLLLLPSSLAYGPSGYGAINGYTPLLFDIELVKVKKGPNAK
jgi:FKBP-type peptidyl-prolyl cis-trans isomerase FkpA